MKKFLFFSLFLLFFLFFSQNVFAFSFGQLDYSDVLAQPPRAGNWKYGNIFEFFVSPSISLPKKLSNFQIRYSSSTSPSSGSLKIYLFSLSDYSQIPYDMSQICNSAATRYMPFGTYLRDYVIASTTISYDYSQDSGVLNFNFGGDFQITNSGYYYIFIDSFDSYFYLLGQNQSSNCQDYALNNLYLTQGIYNNFGADFADFYFGSYWSDHLYNIHIFSSSYPLFQPYYLITLDSAIIFSSILINKPSPDSFNYSNSNFSNFFTLNFLLSSDDICPLQDCYVKTRIITKRVINNEVIDDRFKMHYSYQINIGSNNTTTYPLVPLTYSGTYESQAFMYNMQNQIIASSTPVSFFFISSLDFGTSTTSTINIDISQIYNTPECSFLECPASWLQYGITRAFLFLFVPDESMKNNIKSLFLDIADNFKSGFPFSLLFSISNRLESNLQQLNNEDYSFKLTFLNKNMIILSTSTLNQYLGPNNYDLLRQYLGYAIYLGLALLVLSVL